MELRVGFVSFGLPLMAIGSFIAGYAATIPSPPLCQEQCSAEVANSALAANEYIMRLTTYGLLITLLGFAVIVVAIVRDFRLGIVPIPLGGLLAFCSGLFQFMRQSTIRIIHC